MVSEIIIFLPGAMAQLAHAAAESLVIFRNAEVVADAHEAAGAELAAEAAFFSAVLAESGAQTEDQDQDDESRQAFKPTLVADVPDGFAKFVF